MSAPFTPTLLLVAALAAPSAPQSQSEPETTHLEARPSSELEAANRPPLGMQVRSVDVDGGPERYRLTERTWSDVLADNPDLGRARRRVNAFIPGLVFTGLGGVWLLSAMAATIDEKVEGRRRPSLFAEPEELQPLSAVQITWRFAIPSALVVGGVTATIVGALARRRLFEAKRRFLVGAHASRHGGGLSLRGRF